MQSLSDRTLDQQCTVTRPGIAAIASALLVELLVNVLQHPRGPFAPATASEGLTEEPDQHLPGTVPHQIRGFLANFQNMVIKGKAYDCCSACSDKIVTAYQDDGWEFVRRALNDKMFIETVSGLGEVNKNALGEIRSLIHCRYNKQQRELCKIWKQTSSTMTRNRHFHEGSSPLCQFKAEVD